MWYYQTSVTPPWVGRLCLVYIDAIFFGHAQVSVKNEIYHVLWTDDSLEQCNQIPDHFKRLGRVVSMSSLIPATCNFHVPKWIMPLMMGSRSVHDECSMWKRSVVCFLGLWHCQLAAGLKRVMRRKVTYIWFNIS